MKQINWNAIAKDIELQALDLANAILVDYAQKASQDVKTFLAQTKDQLSLWTQMLAKGEIDRDEFRFLVQGQLDVAELHALKQAGLAQVRFDMFVKGVAGIITNIATKAAEGLI